MPAFVLDEKKICDNTKTILSSNSRRCTIQITFIYIPGYCDILKTEKKWGSFYWQSLCNIRVYQKHAKNLVQAMLVLKSPVFSTSSMANPILFDYLFFFEKILLLIRTLYKFTHKLVAIIFCHLWIVCMYKMNLLSTSKKCSNMTLVFLPLKNWHSFFIIFWECMWFIVTWNVANAIGIR
jgi:hypothetical protein